MLKFGTREQYHKEKGEGIIGEENCPFCNLEMQKNYIIWKGKYWFITHNKFPYTGNEQHLMAVPYSHKKEFLDLIDEELLEFREVHKFIKDFYKNSSYFSCMRETVHERSIEHLHYHFLPGKLQGKYLRKMLQNQGFPIIQEL